MSINFGNEKKEAFSLMVAVFLDPIIYIIFINY